MSKTSSSALVGTSGRGGVRLSVLQMNLLARGLASGPAGRPELGYPRKMPKVLHTYAESPVVRERRELVQAPAAQRIRVEAGIPGYEMGRDSVAKVAHHQRPRHHGGLGHHRPHYHGQHGAGASGSQGASSSSPQYTRAVPALTPVQDTRALVGDSSVQNKKLFVPKRGGQVTADTAQRWQRTQKGFEPGTQVGVHLPLFDNKIDSQQAGKNNLFSTPGRMGGVGNNVGGPPRRPAGPNGGPPSLLFYRGGPLSSAGGSSNSLLSMASSRSEIGAKNFFPGVLNPRQGGGPAIQAAHQPNLLQEHRLSGPAQMQGQRYVVRSFFEGSHRMEPALDQAGEVVHELVEDVREFFFGIEGGINSALGGVGQRIFGNSAVGPQGPRPQFLQAPVLRLLAPRSVRPVFVRAPVSVHSTNDKGQVLPGQVFQRPSHHDHAAAWTEHSHDVDDPFRHLIDVAKAVAEHDASHIKHAHTDATSML